MPIPANVYVRSGIRRVNVANDGDFAFLRGTRDGSLVTMDWLRMLSLEGRVFTAQFGTLDTAVALLTSFVATTPDITIDVPDDIIAIPIYMEATVVASGAAIFHLNFGISPVRTLAASGWTGTVLTELNLRTGSTRRSASVSARTLTAAASPSTGMVYMTHRGNQNDIDGTAIDGTYKWSIQDVPYVPIVEDGGSINLYMYNGTSGTAFAKVMWAEVSKEDLRLPQN